MIRDLTFRKGNEIALTYPCFREGLAGLVKLEKLGLRKKTVRCLPVGEIRVPSNRRNAGLGIIC